MLYVKKHLVGQSKPLHATSTPVFVCWRGHKIYHKLNSNRTREVYYHRIVEARNSKSMCWRDHVAFEICMGTISPDISPNSEGLLAMLVSLGLEVTSFQPSNFIWWTYHHIGLCVQVPPSCIDTSPIRWLTTPLISFYPEVINRLLSSVLGILTSSNKLAPNCPK